MMLNRRILGMPHGMPHKKEKKNKHLLMKGKSLEG